MRKFFCVTFITNLLQLSMLQCFDFQGLKKNNVHDVTTWGVPHWTQIKTCYTFRTVTIQAECRDLQLICWMFRHIPLLFLLSAQKETYSVAVFWYFSSWGILQELTICSCAANAHSLHSKTSSPSLDVFLLLSWFQSFAASQNELNQRNKEIRYSITGLSSSEYWRAGYSRTQFRVPSFPNIRSSTAAGRRELCPNIISLKVLGSCNHRKGKQSHPGDLSGDERKKSDRDETHRGFLIPDSLACHFPSFSPLKLDLRHFSSKGTARKLCLGDFLQSPNLPLLFFLLPNLQHVKNLYGK